MKTFELNKKYENEIINIKVGDLVKLVEEGVKDFVPHLPTSIKDELVVNVCMPILKKFVKPKEEDKKKVEEREKLDKELDKELDQILDLMQRILEIERGN